MVMETRSEITTNNPSPRSVGREFVRQYYTILHEGPQYLHRFYSQNSSFIHGGVEKPGFEQQPVIGQTDIHKKVMSLDFQDCHAKIRQVDSQATIGNGVVVQVTGELSKNGMPMRRFMQTFVLAPQSPKNYYVYNDIFRYQDEVFSDTESEKEEEVLELENDAVDMSSQHEDVNEIPYEAPASQPPIGNGTNHFNDVTEQYNHNVLEENNVLQGDVLESEMKEVDEPEPVEKVTDPVADEKFKKEDETPEPPGPFTWASLASKPGQSTAPVKSMPKPGGKGDVSVPVNAQPQRMPRPPRDQKSGAIRDRGTHSGSTGRLDNQDDAFVRGKQSGSIRHPDSKQLFVGNLPQDTIEADLKEFFEEFGEVIDVRITKTAPGKLPNYAFVTYDSEDSVMKVMESRPLKKFKKDHWLNVELKRKMDNRSGSGPRSNFNPGSRGQMERNNYGGRGVGRGSNKGGSSGGQQNERFTGRQEIRTGGMSGNRSNTGGGGSVGINTNRR